MLLTYYGFLVAGLVLLAAFRGSTQSSESRRVQISYLLVAPLILMMLTLNLGFVGTLLLTVVVILISNSFFKRYAETGVNRDTLFYFLGLWLAEAIAPAVIHLTMRSRPDAERWSLLVTAVVLLSGTILLLAVWAPDLHRKT